jgi:hypothetical protein
MTKPLPDLTRCNAPFCTHSTSSGKPYCSRHIHLTPYVRELRRTLQNQRRELATVRRLGPGAVDLEGLTARNLVLELAQTGACSAASLGRRLHVDTQVLESYLTALEFAGEVQSARHANGRLIFGLRLEPVARSAC